MPSTSFPGRLSLDDANQQSFLITNVYTAGILMVADPTGAGIFSANGVATAYRIFSQAPPGRVTVQGFVGPGGGDQVLYVTG